MILHRNDKNWIVPFLLWLCITLRLIFLWIPVSIFFRPVQTVWKITAGRIVSLIPAKFRTAVAGAFAIAVILIGAFVSEESLNNTRDNRAVSLFGLLVFIGALWATSKHRAHVKWHTVIVGMLMQFVIALFVLRTGVGYDIFNFISSLARSLLGYAHDGVAFLTGEDIASMPTFFMSVVPAIIFFVSLVQLVALTTYCLLIIRNKWKLIKSVIALLLGTHSMVHRQIRRLFLLVDASLWS